MEPEAFRSVFVAESMEPAVHTKKPPRLVSPSGLLRLIGHAAMGVAMGLAFVLILILIDSAGTATVTEHGGSQGAFVATVVLTFAIGATLTGIVFIMTEDD